MNTDQKLLVLTTDLSQSSALATKLAGLINTPQLIELVGDLGGGKTAFVKSFGKALGIEKTITSPTFNIHRGYDFSGGRLEHFDLYRLQDDEIVQNELEDCLRDTKTIVVVEWAEHFSNVLSSDRLVIRFTYLDENSRKLEINASGPKSQKLLDGLR
jgi:tRNA threonylcarbamoyladenosine biosynthesis protein TsaE